MKISGITQEVKLKNNKYKKINFSKGIFYSLFFLIFLIKIIFFIIGKSVLLSFAGGGNDSIYYEAVIEGAPEVVVNSWPIFLSFLNNFGAYSRSGVSGFLFILSAVVIPLLAAKISVTKNTQLYPNIFWLVAIIVGLYPVLFFYSMDIYRDVFMVFIFVAGLFPVKNITEGKRITFIAMSALIAFAIGGILFGLRGYLGFAYLVMTGGALMYGYWGFIRKMSFTLLLLVYSLFAYIAFYFGLLDPLLRYRDGFEIMNGGSNLNLDLTDTLLFIPNFFLSWIYQIFGLWLFSPSAITLFFIESLPFTVAFFYVAKNKNLLTPFAWTLLVFFVVYTTIWVLGNDNLGTAWRLRAFSYLSILICFFNIYQKKLTLRTARNENNRNH